MRPLEEERRGSGFRNRRGLPSAQQLGETGQLRALGSQRLRKTSLRWLEECMHDWEKRAVVTQSAPSCRLWEEDESFNVPRHNVPSAQRALRAKIRAWYN